MTISYNEAKIVNKKLIQFYKKKGINLIPVGSFLRKEKEHTDLDYVTHSQTLGKKYYHSTILFNDKQVSYDIWYIPTRYFKLGTLIRSYPKHYIIAIRNGLIKNGYRLTDKQLLSNEDDTEIPFTSFRKITNLANVVFHPLSYYKNNIYM